jgi:hypothetical protein
LFRPEDVADYLADREERLARLAARPAGAAAALPDPAEAVTHAAS